MTSEKVFEKALKELSSTEPGKERNMYPAIKKIFELLGWNSRNIKTDVSVIHRGVIPDVAVFAKENGFQQLWIVVEAKSQRGLFLDDGETKKILEEKKKYLTAETEWFVLVDPDIWKIIPVIGFVPEANSSKVFNISDSNSRNDLKAFLKSNLSLKVFKEKRKIRAFLEGATDNVAVRSIRNYRDEFYLTLSRSFSLVHQEAKRLFHIYCIPYWEKMKEILTLLKDWFNTVNLITLRTGFYPGVKFYSGLRLDWEKVETAFAKLKDLYITSPALFKLLYEYLWLKGKDITKRFSNSIVFNSVLVLLSKMITIRFLEDYSFFGKEKRFFSNGGLKSFKQVKEYFELAYTDLVKQTAQKVKKLFPALMDDTVYDWVLECADELFSRTIEHILYWFSFFDFSTIEEDILAGIYTHMVLPATRKKLGQVFTPPWIADYIIDRVVQGKGPSCSILDPACGSGTFLVSFIRKTVGQGIKRQTITNKKALELVSKVYGNDVDPFASVIAKLQLAWHVLPLLKEHKEDFQAFKISVGDAIAVGAPNSMFDIGGNWRIYNNFTYDAVVGNPPYVRPEINDRDLTKSERDFYGGLAKANIRALFVYKALRKWLKKGGILGFVLPLSILDSGQERPLRELFKKDWTIKEIVDLELIARYVFPDVAVNPILFLAENRPPQKGDEVTLRFLETVPEKHNFSLGSLSCFKSVKIPYFEVFSDDKSTRILSKITPERLGVIKYLRKFPTFNDIARVWWRRKEGNRFVEASLAMPSSVNTNNWEKSTMIGMGLAFRREKPKGKWEIYKGENILPCQLIDKPVESEIDVKGVSDPSFWRFSEVLPEKAFAFMRITLSPVACQFNPKEKAFLNTATIFFPEEKLKDFPFDFLVLSSLYRFYYSFYLREGVVSQLWSNLYPRTLKNFPWSDKLKSYEKKLKKLRTKYLEACKFTNLDLLKVLKEKVRLDTVENMVLERPEVEFRFSSRDSMPEKGENWLTFYLNLFEWFQVNDRKLFEVIKQAIKTYNVSSLNPEEILNLEIPVDEEALEIWDSVINGDDFKKNVSLKKEVLKELDDIVYEAFGLTDEQVEVIKQAGNTGLMAYTKPPEPFTQRKLRGLWSGLDSADRYVY